MTIRKLGLASLMVLSLVMMGGSGCATSGPNHVYLTTAASDAVQDLGPPRAAIASALLPGEQAVGLAYDFNTDHLFVRVAPTQVIRVIERPSGKTLREMPLGPDLQSDRPADLAIRSSDRHLFAVHADGRSVIELTLFGEFIRRIELTGPEGTIGGLAFDQRNDRLLFLSASSPARAGSIDASGNVTYYVTFGAPVNPVSLGYDSDARHFFVPLADARLVGEFDSSGTLVATHQAGDRPITSLDAGPRSYVRVF